VCSRDVLNGLIDWIRPSNHADPVEQVDELEKDEDVLRTSAGDVNGGDRMLQLEPDDERRLGQVCVCQPLCDVGRDVELQCMRFSNGRRQRPSRSKVERPVRHDAHRQAEIILEDSDERTAHPEETKRASSQTPD